MMGMSKSGSNRLNGHIKAGVESDAVEKKGHGGNMKLVGAIVMGAVGVACALNTTMFNSLTPVARLMELTKAPAPTTSAPKKAVRQIVRDSDEDLDDDDSPHAASLREEIPVKMTKEECCVMPGMEDNGGFGNPHGGICISCEVAALFGGGQCKIEGAEDESEAPAWG